MMIILLISFWSFIRSAGDVIEYNNKIFKSRVLKGDETHFVMFYTKHCGACHQAQPELEKLATVMKPAGLYVGRVDLDKEPSLSRMYQCYSVPKFLLFRPNRDYMEYQSYRTAKQMGTFMLENQLGEKQVFVADKEEKLKSMFNETGRLPRVVLFSHKAAPPPMLKQLCFKHRKKIMCWLASDNKGSGGKDVLGKITEKLDAFRGEGEGEYEYPSIHSFDRMQEPGKQLMDYKGKLVFDKLDEFFTKIEKEREKVVPPTEEEIKKDKEKEKEDGDKKKTSKKKQEEKEDADTDRSDKRSSRKEKEKEDTDKDRDRKKKKEQADSETESDEELKEEAERKRRQAKAQAEKEKKEKEMRAATKLRELNESTWDSHCLKINRLCVLFLLAEKNGSCTDLAPTKDEFLAEQRDILDEIIRQNYAKQEYSFLWTYPCYTSSVVSSATSTLTPLLSYLGGILPPNTPSIVALNPHKGKIAHWIVKSPADTDAGTDTGTGTDTGSDANANTGTESGKVDGEGGTGGGATGGEGEGGADTGDEEKENPLDTYTESILNLWTHTPVFMDKLVGGEVRFSREDSLAVPKEAEKEERERGGKEEREEKEEEGKKSGRKKKADKGGEDKEL